MAQPTAQQLLQTPGALIGVEHLRALGLDDRAIARVLYGLPEIAFPGVERVYFAAERVRARLIEKGLWP
jgi:hypothetical protein